MDEYNALTITPWTCIFETQNETEGPGTATV